MFPNEAAGIATLCGGESMMPDACPANIDLMFLVMAQYPRVEHATWMFAAMLGYFADGDGVVAPPFLRLLDEMGSRIDIVVADEIPLLVYSGWLCPLQDDQSNGAYQISPDWIAKAKKAPPLPSIGDAELVGRPEQRL